MPGKKGAVTELEPTLKQELSIAAVGVRKLLLSLILFFSNFEERWRFGRQSYKFEQAQGETSSLKTSCRCFRSKKHPFVWVPSFLRPWRLAHSNWARTSKPHLLESWDSPARLSSLLAHLLWRHQRETRPIQILGCLRCLWYARKRWSKGPTSHSPAYHSHQE